MVILFEFDVDDDDDDFVACMDDDDDDDDEIRVIRRKLEILFKS